MTTLQPDALEEVSRPYLVPINGLTHRSQIFLKLEEESERRALEAEDAAHSPNIPDLAVPAQRAARRRHRHRASVSISRFGHVSGMTTSLQCNARSMLTLTIRTPIRSMNLQKKTRLAHHIRHQPLSVT